MGRPKGALNKRTKGIPAELAEALGFKDPAEVLSAIIAMPMDDMKRIVRSKAGAQALAFKIRACEVAMPYLHSKMPVKVQVEGEDLPTLVIVKGIHQMQQIQALMKDVTPPVGMDAAASDGKGKRDQGDDNG